MRTAESASSQPVGGAAIDPTLESFQVRSRLNRGRSYARRGQVLHLEIANHKVTATVQVSSPITNVTIELRRIPIA